MEGSINHISQQADTTPMSIMAKRKQDNGILRQRKELAAYMAESL